MLTIKEGSFAGGVERAFMSTTKNPKVALDYSCGVAAKGSVFAIDFDMSSRGADVKWVSQYPHEEVSVASVSTSLDTADAPFVCCDRNFSSLLAHASQQWMWQALGKRSASS